MQALLKSSESAGFCSGVILKENLVLTSAQCANKYSTFQVAVGEQTEHISTTPQQQGIKKIKIHKHALDVVTS